MNPALLMPNREITNDCVGLGFYSVSPDSDAVNSFYGDLLAWFQGVGCPPDKLAVLGKGFGRKPVSFAKAHARLSKQGFSAVKSFTVFAMLPDGIVPALDWWAIATLDLGLALRPYFALAAGASITTLEDDSLTRLIFSCVSNLKPMYGIGFTRSHNRGPWFYAAGMHFGPPIPEDRDEALTISRWGDFAVVKEVYKEGILRDVYPHNYLSEPQLTRRIGAQTIQEWILSNSSHGTLAKLDDRMMLWKVPPEHIIAIRNELWSFGIIFDWKKYLDE
jgi:hypothetical protein